MSTFQDTELAGLSPDSIQKLYQTLIDPSVCKPPVTVDSPVLEADMVVTVEPGIYFSEFALSRVYLRDPKHAKFINKDILVKYMAVGGVRIEDDILVTKNGHENLTTAPKGDEALKIIRGEPDVVIDSTVLNSVPSSVALPPSAPCVTSVDMGKTPSRCLPADLQKTLNDGDSIRDGTPQLTEDLSTKCSTDVKQDIPNVLPPSAEAQGLIKSFPFGQ
jgi:hypothetical protein